MGETGVRIEIISQIQVFESRTILWMRRVMVSFGKVILTESGTYQVVTGTNEDGIVKRVGNDV